MCRKQRCHSHAGLLLRSDYRYRKQSSLETGDFCDCGPSQLLLTCVEVHGQSVSIFQSFAFGHITSVLSASSNSLFAWHCVELRGGARDCAKCDSVIRLEMRFGLATAVNVFSLASLQLICQLGISHPVLRDSVGIKRLMRVDRCSLLQMHLRFALSVVQANQCMAIVKGHLNDNFNSSSTEITASTLKNRQLLTAALRSGQATSGTSSCIYLTPHLLSQGSKPFSQSYSHHGFIPPSPRHQLCHSSSLLTLTQNRWQ